MGILDRASNLLAVWEKGHEILGQDPDVWRRDDFDNVIRWGDHGNRDSDYGWEVDHIVPVSEQGDDSLGNLRPLQWRQNVRRNRILL